MELKIDCDYCEPIRTLFHVSLPPLANEAAWRAAWKATLTGAPDGGPQFRGIKCDCGAEYIFEDDGIPTNSGGFLRKKNISRPRIDSLTVTGGPRDGGIVTTILGSALGHNNVAVNFDLNSAKIIEKTAKSITVVAPYGRYILNIAEGPLRRITVVNQIGSFTADETITIESVNITGVLRKITSSGLLLHIESHPKDINWRSLIGNRIRGARSGASASVSATDLPTFTQGEQVIGLLSNASAVFRSNSRGMVVDRPNNSFAPSELIIGMASGAIAKLSRSPSYSGNVDVSVSNEFGSRTDGSSCLANGFTYF